MPRPIFDVHYADGRTKLVMEADLREGWRKLTKTYGFFQQKKIPYKNDISLRAQLSLIAQPASFGQWAQSFPLSDIGNGIFGNDGLSFHFNQERLTVSVALHRDQPWRLTPQGRPELYIEMFPFYKVDHAHWYNLQGLIVAHEGLHRPIPDVRVWVENKLVVPGGQFESSRRRH